MVFQVCAKCRALLNCAFVCQAERTPNISHDKQPANGSPSTRVAASQSQICVLVCTALTWTGAVHT